MSSYLCKYATKAETHSRVHLQGKNVDSVTVTSEGIENIHLSTDKFVDRLQQKKKGTLAYKSQVKEISYGEVLMNTHRIPYVHTNVQFVHASTLLPECRSGYLKNSPSNIEVFPQEGREDFPIWRQFSQTQVLLCQEIASSPLVPDATTCFSIRPPELMIFNNLIIFLKCFAHGKKSKESLDFNLENCPWIDGIGRRYWIRISQLKNAINFLEKRNAEGQDHRPKELLDNIFYPCLHGDETKIEMFVDLTAEKEVVVVSSLVKPSAQAQLLYHLCMTMGRVDTDLDFMMKR